MDLLQAIILGIIQGITEFLPISSSGHLVLLEKIWSIDDSIIFFNVILHFATLLAVIIFYHRKITNLILHPFNKTNRLLILCTIPTILIVLIFNSFFESTFSGGLLIVGFLITALFLIITEKISKNYEKSLHNYSNIDNKKAVLLGVFQGLAVMPGLSRSGTTVCAGIIMGIEKKEAIDFSFLMSIPIIIASMVYELLKLDTTTISNINIPNVIIGSAFAFIFAILGIKLMLKVVEKIKYSYFAIYLIVLSVAIIFI